MDQRYVKDLISQAMVIMRDWISRSFKRGLLSSGLTSLYQVEATVEIEVSSLVILCK